MLVVEAGADVARAADSAVDRPAPRTSPTAPAEAPVNADAITSDVNGEPTVAAVPGEGGREATATKITSTGDSGKLSAKPTTDDHAAKPTTDERSAKPKKVSVDAEQKVSVESE